jgi:hypothetical protein
LYAIRRGVCAVGQLIYGKGFSSLSVAEAVCPDWVEVHVLHAYHLCMQNESSGKPLARKVVI